MFTKLEGPALEAVRRLAAELRRRALEGGIPPEELTIRSLRPEDLGFTGSEWTFDLTSADAFNTNAINVTLSNMRWVGVYGIMVGESGAQVSDQLRFTVNGRRTAYWQIQNANYLQDNSMYFEDVVIGNENNSFTVDIYATAADSDHQLSFLGLVAERKGMLVQPS